MAVGHIIENFPDDICTMVSPFFGGGSVEIACANELDISVFGYDVFRLLCEYWDTQKYAPDILAGKLDEMKPTKETYNEVKTKLTHYWNGESTMSPGERVVYFWFNHNLSYGPGFLGWMSKIYEDEAKYRRMVSKVRNFSSPYLRYVRQGSFDDIIPAYNGAFLYCDPPYYLDDGKMFKGIYPQRNFPIYHKGFNHELLCKLLKQHKGGFVLSYNDCATIREMYKKFEIKEVGWQYTMGQGETRIGKNRLEDGRNTNIKQSHEILIIGNK